MNPRTGEVEFIDSDGKLMRPLSVYSEITYERDKKPKTIARFHLDPSGPLNATPEANLVRFDRLYVADTTPLSSAEDTVAFTGVGILRTHRVSSEMTALEFEMAALLEFHGLRDINPELAGWATILELVRTAPDYDPGWLVGLIGDSELDQLKGFNERQSPIAGSIMLPHNFRMHYAAGATSDSVLNQAIKTCDRLSRQAVDKLLRESPPSLHPRLPAAGVPCSWWRLWIRAKPRDRAVFEVAEASARVDSGFRLVRSTITSL